MPFITRYDRFDTIRPYVTGGGCLMCGSNSGPMFDTGVSVSRFGYVAFCETHAREFGLALGMVDKTESDALTVSAHEELAIAGKVLERAAEEREQAARERQVVEDLVRRITGAAETPEELGEGAKL